MQYNKIFIIYIKAGVVCATFAFLFMQKYFLILTEYKNLYNMNMK